MADFTKSEMITQNDVDWLIPRVGKEWLTSKIRGGRYIVVDEETIRKSKDNGPLPVYPADLVYLKRLFPGEVIDEVIRSGSYLPIDENGNKVDRAVKSWRQKPKEVYRLDKFMGCKRCKKLIQADANYCCYCSLEIPQKRSAKKRPIPSGILP